MVPPDRNPSSVPPGFVRSGPARDLYRVAAILTALTAWTYSNLGAGHESDRWWRTAHRMASISRDPAMQTWVAGQNGLMAIYRDDWSPDAVVAMLGQVEHLAKLKGSSCTSGAAYFFCAKSQALGMSGRRHEAEEALEQLRDITETMDSQTDVCMSDWSSARLFFAESYTYSHLGDYRRAVSAQDRASSTTPAWLPLHRLKMELQRSLCLAKTGAATDAAQHATVMLAVLPEAQHDLPTANLARSVLHALPATRRSTSSVDELARYVATRKAVTAHA